MSRGSTCDCTICNIETQLLTDLSKIEEHALADLSRTSHFFQPSPTVASFLARIRAVTSVEQADESLREILSARILNPPFIESLVILAFLPMLHRTVRRVAQQQPMLSEDDIAQQALIFLIQVLRSGEITTRRSHLAFAISRAVKRRVFEWTHHERVKEGIGSEGVAALAALTVEEHFERHALLQHFLHRCVRKGLLSPTELDLLVQFKLDGGDRQLRRDKSPSNAVRQKLKRLLAKLRRLAN